MKHTSNLQKLYLSFLLFNLLMNNHQFLVIHSLEHMLTLIVAEHTNIKRINHIHNVFSMPNIMEYTRLVLPFSNKKV